MKPISEFQKHTFPSLRQEFVSANLPNFFFFFYMGGPTHPAEP